MTETRLSGILPYWLGVFSHAKACGYMPMMHLKVNAGGSPSLNCNSGSSRPDLKDARASALRPYVPCRVVGTEKFGIVAVLGMDGHNGRAGCPYPAETPAQRDERWYVVAGR